MDFGKAKASTIIIVDCKDCHKKQHEVELKKFRTGFICRPCLESLHFKRFRYFFQAALKKNEPTCVYIVDDSSINTRYITKLLDQFIKEEKDHKIKNYDIEICVLKKEVMNNIPIHLYERYIINNAKEHNGKTLLYLDSASVSTKAARVLTAVSCGDVVTVPSVGYFHYTFPGLAVVRPVDFTDDEVAEYMLENNDVATSDGIFGACETFVKKLEVDYDQTGNAVISTAQRVVEDKEAKRCVLCMRPYVAFLNDCKDGKCRTCSKVVSEEVMKSLM
ncbi:hypothetical protein EIN_411270 [Entamoeba invadens IP1]|uniref:Cytoplasmic tRNA 2-thiolation protein 2 n=1 Tax=Entamoeba invadens IP1 TaxID=370355 RepID=A0A0A1U726_ENTIV|nr:hypothetical protein EIN_411270 [Entamoeba invadens IP1]ELP87774.1 hypothetical protein EIN_411270 [Entamoeba invadens IP1]|eukprot:XP_004254545.1 hypothetical protein EIN_411270 [Entamoeba invadens IP1]